MKRALVWVVLLACSKSTNDLPPETWGVDDYAKAGLAIDQPWSAADFSQAATVLAKTSEGHRERLPRFHGAKSGGVFDKLVADMPDDSAHPLGERMETRLAHLGAINAISKLYFPNTMVPPTREWVELTGAQLREAMWMTAHVDEIIASFGSDDPKHETRMQGVAKMRRGYGEMLVGATLMAADKRAPEADRVALVNHMTAALPALFPTAPAESQQLVRKNLKELLAALPAGELHDAVAAAQRALP